MCETLLHFKVELNFVLEQANCMHFWLHSLFLVVVVALGLRGSKPSKSERCYS